MGKFDDSSGDEENYFNELRNFELKVLPGLHLRSGGLYRQVWLTFLTFSSDHCSFKLILPNNESDRSFLKASACVQVQPCRRATHQTWKGKRNPQTCCWIRPSKTAQSQGCLFAFFSTPIFKKCLGPYCSFLLPRTPWRTEISATKKPLNHVQFVFDSSGNWSGQSKLNWLSRNAFTEQVSFVVSLICSWTDSLKLLVFLRSRKCKL